MTTSTDSKTYALDKLEQLARCQGIRPFQAGDEDLVCANDLIGIYRTGGGYIHDMREVGRLRDAALDEVWPR